MKTLQGIAVSPGIVEGTAFVVDLGQVSIPKYWLRDREVEHEISRFQEALKRSEQQIRTIQEKLRGKLSYQQGREHLLILEGHLAMLEDAAVTDHSRKIIAQEKINAEWALSKIQRNIFDSFSKIDAEYFRERQNDIGQVFERVQRNLMGKSVDGPLPVQKPTIVLAHDLSPADMAQLPRNLILALVTERGGRTSHTGIIAAAMGIPAIVGVENLLKSSQTGDTVIIDGNRGVILVKPNKETRADYVKMRKRYLDQQVKLEKERDLPQETEDHYPLSLSCNLELLEEIPFILAQGANRIGLFRTEMLLMHNSRLPTEDEQTQAYSEILKKFSPQSVTMRTYDFGGEKFSHVRKVSPVPMRDRAQEPNPALGLRAIRLCLKEDELFRTQLRAMLRASVHGNLRILLPMVSSVDEVRDTKRLIKEVRAELKGMKVPVTKKILLGTMIETPASVIIAELLAKEADFFSVGTNDLIQYTLAVDRVNEDVAYLFNPLDPAVLRLLDRISVISRKFSIPVNLCGEMASDPLYLPILVGFGFHEISLNAIMLSRVKHILLSLRAPDCRKILKKILQFESARESMTYLRTEMKRRFPKEFSGKSGIS